MSYIDNGWWYYCANVAGTWFFGKGHTKRMAQIDFEDQLIESGLFN